MQSLVRPAELLIVLIAVLAQLAPVSVACSPDAPAPVGEAPRVTDRQNEDGSPPGPDVPGSTADAGLAEPALGPCESPPCIVPLVGPVVDPEQECTSRNQVELERCRLDHGSAEPCRSIEPVVGQRCKIVRRVGKMSDGMRAALLLERPIAMDWARATECLIAIRTATGWFIQQAGEICRGVTGPSSSVSYSTRAFRASRNGDRADLIHVSRQTRLMEGNDVGPNGGRVTSYWREFEDRIVICGRGESDRPSCIQPMSLGCGYVDTDPLDPPVRVRWSYRDSVLTTHDEGGACDVSPGGHRIRFP